MKTKMEFIEKPQAELAFEDELIDYLQHLGGTKQWEYRPGIKTIPQLWDNFRTILERNNADKLQGKPLSDQEFAQVQKEICALTSPSPSSARMRTSRPTCFCESAIRWMSS